MIAMSRLNCVTPFNCHNLMHELVGEVAGIAIGLYSVQMQNNKEKEHRTVPYLSNRICDRSLMYDSCCSLLGNEGALKERGKVREKLSNSTLLL